MKSLVLRAIRLYQATGVIDNPIRKMFVSGVSVCRFQPTCSEYAYAAVEKYGVLKGTIKGIARIARCHPWSKGGYDPLV
ncbi:MAG: putative membrane protein insertion efficiency factor [Microgenomates bacterium OLB23]|nr:MAG: putative membrane protein insertion efficiency factor [Microgenomates bacterium OLB23]